VDEEETSIKIKCKVSNINLKTIIEVYSRRLMKQRLGEGASGG
jgi:hypothetical protein